MIHDPDLLAFFEERQAGARTLIAYRHMFARHPPTAVNTLGARWNPREVGAIYASLSRETALAEAEHRISLEPFRPKAKRTLYKLEVHVESHVDLNSVADLQALGIGNEELVSYDFKACQSVGAAIHFLGIGGLLVPSVRAEGANLVIYTNSGDGDVTVLDSEEVTG